MTSRPGRPRNSAGRSARPVFARLTAHEQAALQLLRGALNLPDSEIIGMALVLYATKVHGSRALHQAAALEIERREKERGEIK